ncbi:unnamed protein product [Mytilus coruscus]|uniref:Integrase catalytic domain-containing protein n=1 Tax=Mytilus coruscus TaxID=42192 RepID=A0A6J8AD74_MYTCO|nr:unnamed protein product [Mytilus coruscus]
MESLKELREYGESLGLVNGDLIRFIETQQARQRDDRRIERKREKEEWEIEKVRLEHDLELKKLDNTRILETEKQKEKKNEVMFTPSKVPKLPPFEEGTDDIDAYLRRYKRYAISQKWDKSIWATHLSALLKGNALNVYALLPSDQALDYDALKTCALKRLNMTEVGFKLKFKSCLPESGETFQQFLVRLGCYFSRWIDMSNVLKTFDGLYDLMLRDQFLHTGICYNECNKSDSIKTTQLSSPMIPSECEKKPIKMPVVKGNIDGAREPYDPDISLSVSVVTRQQAKQRDNPIPILKVSGSIKGVILEDIEREQQSDKSLMKLRQYVAEGRNFEKTNGTKELMSPKVENGKTFRQLIVLEAYRTDNMKLAHESLMAGHMATRRTVYRVLSEFYWPGVESDVKRYCRSCDICQRTVPKGKQNRAPLGKTPIIDVPFRRVAVDLPEPLEPVTDNGNRYIITLVDNATRYPEGKLYHLSTERVAEALIDIFCRVGFPREMLTDMGAQFTSNLMSEVSRLISLRKLTTTPYHPMCNGLVEKFNGTMKLMLKRLCAKRPRDWDKYLGPALFAFREVAQESVLFSPFELEYGWPVRGPMTFLKELWTREITDPDVRSTYEYVINL